MKSRFLTLLSLFLILLLAFAIAPSQATRAQGTTITSTTVGGPWNDPDTWIGGVVPTENDSVVIDATEGSVVLSGATTIQGSLTINANAELETNGHALTLKGDFINNGLLNAAASNIILAGTDDQSIGGFTTGGSLQMTKTGGTATLTGNVTAASLILNGSGGTLDLGTGRSHTISGAVTLTAGTLSGNTSTLRVGGNFSVTGGAFLAGTGTVIYNGSGAQNVAGLTYHHLRFQGGGTKTAQGNITVNGNLQVNSGPNFSVGAYDLIVNGSTSISGILTLAHSSGTKTFTGPVSINAGGSWTNSGNASVTFKGGLTHNGNAFTAGSGTYTFSDNDQAIGGSKPISISNLSIPTGITLTNNNTAGLTVTNNLTGGGEMVQGSDSKLNINVLDSNRNVSLDASAAGNTVTYGLAGAQTVLPSSYYHLTLSGSGAKTLPTSLTIAGNLTLSGSASTTTSADLTIEGNLSLSSGTSLTVGPHSFSVNGTTTVGSGGTLTFNSGSGQKVFQGLVTNNGTWNNPGEATITFQNGFAGTLNDTNNGTYRFVTASQSIATGATLNVANVVADAVTLENNGTLTVRGNLSGSGALVNKGTLNLVGDVTITSLSASFSGNTVSYTGNASQIRAIPYHNLTVGGGVARTLPTGVTVNGNLTTTTNGTSLTLNEPLTVGGNLSVSGNTTLALAGNNLTVNGASSISGTLNAGSAQITVMGNLTCTGTISGTPTVVLQGTASQNINADASCPLHNLTLNNSAGATLITNDLTVNGILHLENGKLTVPSGRILIIGPNGTITGAGSAKHIITTHTGTTPGRLRKSFGTSTSPQTFKFEIGASDRYAPVEITLTSVSTAGNISATVFPIDHPQIHSAIGLLASKSVNLYWRLTPATIVFDNYSATFFFDNADIDPSANPGNFVVKRYVSGTGGGWFSTTTGHRTSNSTQATDIPFTSSSTAYEFAVGEGDDIPPAITSITASTADGRYKAEATISGITVTFSEPVFVSGTPTLTLDTDATLNYQSGSGTNTLTFQNYIVQPGHNSPDLNVRSISGTIKDEANNPANLTLPTGANLADNKDIVIDTTPPSVGSVTRVHEEITACKTVQFTVTFSEAVTGVDVGDFTLTTSGVTDATITSVSGSDTSYTVTVNTGSGLNGTIRLDVVDNDSIEDTAGNPLSAPFNSGQTYTIRKVLVFYSAGGYDGWVLESSATSNQGGSINATATTFIVGDDAKKRQYCSILHFDTAPLPDNAVITKVTLKFLKAGGSGNTSSLGALLADITKPSYGSVSLQASDFQATGGSASAFNSFTISSNWYSATLKSTASAQINLLGTTQVRLRFTKQDDGDSVADNLTFYSGNYGTQTGRPQLIVEFYVP